MVSPSERAHPHAHATWRDGKVDTVCVATYRIRDDVLVLLLLSTECCRAG